MFKNNKLAFVLSVVTIISASIASARPNIGGPTRPDGQLKSGQLKGTASCKPAENAIDLDINNVRARLMTGGDMWWDNGTNEARYEVPKNSKKNALFAGSCWVGGVDVQGQLKVAAQTYRQSGNDYWPGPLDPITAQIDAATCSEWDRFWKIEKQTINRFRELGDKTVVKSDPQYDIIYTWPAKGNTNAIGRNQNSLAIPSDRDYAPFVNVGGSDSYEPDLGDYPGIDANTELPGDQYIWWVFNDKGNIKQQTQTEGIGLEVQASAFAYATKDYLNDATFYNYRLINRGGLTLDSTFMATWTDADLGYYKDDYIGCDVGRSLGILYNGKSEDGQGEPNAYGTQVPMVGVDFFKGPMKPYDSAGKRYYRELGMEAFTYFNNNGDVIGNPNNGAEIYYYMTGSVRNGQRFVNDFQGPGINSKGYGNGAESKYVFTGDPSISSEWSECACLNSVDDRRFIHSAGPFVLEPGVVNDITIGAVWVPNTGGCPNTSFTKIRAADDVAQSLFNNRFQTIEGPQAPTMTVREMDKKLVFYLTNETSSTNYGERYGYDTAKKFRVSAISTKFYKPADSLYKFEGYRVFQVKNSTVQPAQIFDASGQLNSELAAEVFQCDIKNGITRIINYERLSDISDTTFVPRVMVTGKDSGIRHSFEITIDQFSTSQGKQLINYRNYYFVAIAYAYNDFSYNPITRRGGFSVAGRDTTQDRTYIESAKGAGGKPIPVVVGMPNPANSSVGTVLNSDYGDGVVIKRLEGTGNGGNDLNLSTESENEALTAPAYHALTPTYKQGSGPVNVKVIDPLMVKPIDWELFIYGSTQTAEAMGLDSMSTWELVDVTTGNKLYSERNISILNEQILADYGIAVTIKQVKRPTDEQDKGNGYIASDINFKDPSKPWLAGSADVDGAEPYNWIRSGNNNDPGDTVDCNYDDKAGDTVDQVYEKMFANFTSTKGSWAPYGLTSDDANANCGIGIARPGTISLPTRLPSVDLVFTSDKSKWTKCVVLEMQESNTGLSEGGTNKFNIRSHQSWNLDVDAAGRPVYSTVSGDTGMSWFPGYAVNQETGERLNIIFGEDSWLKAYNGADMLWNPTPDEIVTDQAGVASRIFGGKHYVYILNSKYDECADFKNRVRPSNTLTVRLAAFTDFFMWAGKPLLARQFKFTSFEEGYIPTETRLRFRVNRPYGVYAAGNVDRSGGRPLYSFSTKGIAPVAMGDNASLNKDELLDRIHAVPNPYYGYTGYEANRLDTRVRITNLPQKATISIYSLDGSLIRKLEKDNPNVSYLDWDIRNTKGLPIASGMYLMHVKADGLGEIVLRWFGAMRPLDLTTY